MVDITVAICCYKQKKWLHRCLRSLANQTIDPSCFEVVIVNDDPDPEFGLEEICDSMKAQLNIRLINNSKNLGLPESLNKILNIMKGRFFVRVDSDDYVSEHFLYMLSCFLKMNENFQGVFCDYKKVDKVGRRIETCSAKEFPIACGVMYTYESLCEVGFYNENFKMREGHELLKRYKQKYDLFHMNVPLYRYRIHEENRTKDKQRLKNYDSMLYNENENNKLNSQGIDNEK